MRGNWRKQMNSSRENPYVDKCFVFGAAVMLAGCAVEPYGPGHDQGYSGSYYSDRGYHTQPGYDRNQPGYYYQQR